MSSIIPIPQADVSVREATLADVAFIDALQKMHSDRVGFMRTSWIEEKIRAGQVIVAVTGHSSLVTRGETPGVEGPASDEGQVTNDIPVGYCMGVDRYFKRDDVGIIHQMNVVPARRRQFIAAALLKAMFDRAAYGCRLFCCWCAQDIEANHFWESMGFVPLAYRAGSEKKRRIHIFWQKRIRPDDTTTPWWFPAKTDAGAMGADRIVLPIPPGKHWSDEMPILRPALSGAEGTQDQGVKALPHETEKAGGKRALGGKRGKGGPQTPTPQTRAKAKFGKPGAEPVVAAEPEKAAKKPVKAKREKVKADPAIVAKARELRDRWLEHVNAGQAGGASIESAGKYDVTRAIAAKPVVKQLPLAA